MKNRKLILLALFTALSAVGAAIKIPAPIGSVAFDVFPALLAAALLGSGAGAIVGALGHLLSALIAGFPLGPLHILIAIEMALLVFIFGVLYKKNKKGTASILFVLANAFAAPLPFIFIMNKAFYFALVPSLLVGSIVNTVIALVAIPRLKALVKQDLIEKDVKI
ncbi:ECF transporter S component [Bacillus sp. EB106-08-02-XG196]|uniref:ECF transporter S component n=1 Tax=Bacillus sp. EB106-08-02-XG196 TaxID=2737049 RepID=UPI0015C42E17|nr:ECF transporter S component [Bacillus sp. EB106-08-02-XG196]NWQ41575.1 ECF transporter S component [Bacillus sp. EB106-08-02-XG196]